MCNILFWLIPPTSKRPFFSINNKYKNYSKTATIVNRTVSMVFSKMPFWKKRSFTSCGTCTLFMMSLSIILIYHLLVTLTTSAFSYEGFGLYPLSPHSSLKLSAIEILLTSNGVMSSMELHCKASLI